MSELKGAAKRIFGGLQNRLSKLARFGQSKHEAKQEAREAYLKKHGTLAGYNPAWAPWKLTGLPCSPSQSGSPPTR